MGEAGAPVAKYIAFSDLMQHLCIFFMEKFFKFGLKLSQIQLEEQKLN